jgi:hypothetical protein
MGKLIHKDKGIKHLPAGKTSFQEGAQFANIDGRTVFQDQNSKRALLPFRVGYCDDCYFFDCFVVRESILEVD